MSFIINMHRQHCQLFSTNLSADDIPVNPNQLAESRERYTAAVLLGDLELARSVVSETTERGASTIQLYLHVLAPTQIKLGELWHEGEINIAREHLATSITISVMEDQIRGSAPWTSIGLRATVAPVEGDQHFIGARMIADALTLDGWDVDFLWNSSPADDLVEYLQHRHADLIAISATISDSLPNVVTTARSIRAMPESRPKILLGGAAVLNAQLPVEHYGADAIAENIVDAVHEARRIVGFTQENPTLEERLTAMGRRIRAARTSRKMTQQQLADQAGLDRTYISLVEHGRQNITISAIVNIAEALDIPVTGLLDHSD